MYYCQPKHHPNACNENSQQRLLFPVERNHHQDLYTSSFIHSFATGLPRSPSLRRNNLPLTITLESTLITLSFACAKALGLPLLNTFHTLQLRGKGAEKLSIEALIVLVVLGPASISLVSQLQQTEMPFDELSALGGAESGAFNVLVLSVGVVMDAVLSQNLGRAVIIVDIHSIIYVATGRVRSQPAQDILVYHDCFPEVVCS